MGQLVKIPATKPHALSSIPSTGMVERTDSSRFSDFHIQTKAHIHTHKTSTQVHTQIHTHTHIYKNKHMCKHTFIHTHTRIHTYMHRHTQFSFLYLC